MTKDEPLKNRKMEPSFNDSSVSFHETVSIRNFRGKHIANHHLCDLCQSCHSGNSSSILSVSVFPQEAQTFCFVYERGEPRRFGKNKHRNNV